MFFLFFLSPAGPKTSENQSAILTTLDLRQVLVVDANLELFSRAWCMAEIAEAYMMGILELVFSQDLRI